MTEFHFICSIILWLNESDFLTYMVRTWKSTSYQKCHSLSLSISPSTLQPGLTRRVPRLTSAFLIACWDLWEGQGPVKTVWMGRWGKPCDFSASLPLRCVWDSPPTDKRWQVIGQNHGDMQQRRLHWAALSNYLIWARLQTERERGSSLLYARYLRLCFMFTQLLRNAVHSNLHKLPSLSQITALPAAQHRGKLLWNTNLCVLFLYMCVWNRCDLLEDCSTSLWDHLRVISSWLMKL